jgi:hypothetical protein
MILTDLKISTTSRLDPSEPAIFFKRFVIAAAMINRLET